MKHIVVSGCSFTNNFRCNLDDERRWERDSIEDWTWAHWLQNYLKDTHILHNYGTITNDNKTIVRSIIYKVTDLLKEGVKPEDISVVAQWTTLTRNSFFVTPQKYDNNTNPAIRYIKKNESWAHTNDYLINGKDKESSYQQGYFHLTGGFNPTNNPIDIDSVTFTWLDKLMTYDERYFEWFEYVNMLLDFLHINGITKIKFFCMNNNFSKKYLNQGKTPPYYHTPKEKSVYECIIENKDICNTWEQKELQFNNSYVKSYANKIDFKKYFWFFEENFVHLYGGIIEWSIRNFNYELEKDNLPKVLWREMNGMNLNEQKNYLEKSWYGHTSSILTNKFTNDVILNWDIF
jgi:hypothetical protein